jgi:hypothetical protein
MGGWNPQPYPYPLQSNSFYPQQGRPLGMQQGTPEVTPIGTPQQGGRAYGPPVQLSSPDIMKYLQDAGKKQGLSQTQITGLMEAFKSFGGMGGGSSQLYGETGAPISALTAAGGFQGGISDIGYPPFLAPEAEFHGDRGGWLGTYNPDFMVPRYQRGTASVSRFW